jgi:integrase
VGRALDTAREHVPSLDPRFRFQDLRHYYASLLMSEELDVTVVQARTRHANATTTLNVHGHMFPDKGRDLPSGRGQSHGSPGGLLCTRLRTSG